MSGWIEWLPTIVSALALIAVVEVLMKNRGLPPGPWGLPFFGYYYSLDRKAHVTLMDLSKKYGGILSFRTIGGTLFVVLNGLDAIKEVILTKADEFIGRPLEMNFIKWLDGGYGILQEEGEAWKDQKRFFLSTVRNYGFGKVDMEVWMHELIDEMVTDLKKLQGAPADIYDYISHVSGNVMCRILCSRKFSRNDLKFRELKNRIVEMVSFFSDRRLFLTGPIFEHVMLKLTPTGRRLKESKSIVEKFVSDEVEEHMRTLDIDNPRDFTDSYLIHLKEMEEKGKLKNSSFSVLRLKKIFYGMFLEGTASDTMCALLFELAKHPEIQKKAQMELDEVVGRDRYPSWADKKNLPYVDAVVQELFRTSFVFAISAYYSNFKEASVRGFRIPKRSFVVANLYSVNNDPKIYPNPSKFDPERFLGSDGNRIKQDQPIPFGIGKRSCTGESLATMEVFAIVSSMLQNFNIYPTDDAHKLRLEAR